MRPAAKVALNLAAVALLAGGVLVVRDLTQSTHHRRPADSRLRVVVEPVQNRSEPSQTLEAVARAHLAFCDVEVSPGPMTRCSSRWSSRRRSTPPTASSSRGAWRTGWWTTT